MNIDHIAMCYISIDRLNELYKLMESFFFKFRNHFSNWLNYFLNNSGVRFMQERRGGICAEQHAF